MKHLHGGFGIALISLCNFYVCPFHLDIRHIKQRRFNFMMDRAGMEILKENRLKSKIGKVWE